jgi:hypothetical protein
LANTSCEAFRRRGLDRDAGFLRLPDSPATGTVHVGEQLVLAARQIGLKIPDDPAGDAEVGDTLRRQPAIDHLVVQAAELTKGEPFEPRERVGARDVGVQVEAHIGGGPAAERAAEDRHAAAAEQDAAEEPRGLAVLLDLGDHDLAAGDLLHELQPAPTLHHHAVGVAVEELPVDLVERDPMKFEHAPPRACDKAPDEGGSLGKGPLRPMPEVATDTRWRLVIR